jgi:hypothetical protein
VSSMRLMVAEAFDLQLGKRCKDDITPRAGMPFFAPWHAKGDFRGNLAGRGSLPP